MLRSDGVAKCEGAGRGVMRRDGGAFDGRGR